MLDEGRVCERKRISPFLELPVYLRRQDGLPEEYWAASILTSRLLVLIEKAGLSIEAYNPHLRALQFGVAQKCVIPFGRTFSQSVTQRASTPIDNAPEALVKLPTPSLVRALHNRVQIGETIAFSRAWLSAWSQLHERLTYFSLCDEMLAYSVKAKVAHGPKRKASAGKFISPYFD